MHEELRTFFVVSLGGLLLTVNLAYVFLNSLLPWLLSLTGLAAAHLNAEFISHVAAVGIVALYSFTAHKLFSFGKGFRHFLRR